MTPGTTLVLLAAGTLAGFSAGFFLRRTPVRRPVPHLPHPSARELRDVDQLRGIEMEALRDRLEAAEMVIDVVHRELLQVVDEVTDHTGAGAHLLDAMRMVAAGTEESMTSHLGDLLVEALEAADPKPGLRAQGELPQVTAPSMLSARLMVGLVQVAAQPRQAVLTAGTRGGLVVMSLDGVDGGFDPGSLEYLSLSRVVRILGGGVEQLSPNQISLVIPATFAGMGLARRPDIDWCLLAG